MVHDYVRDPAELAEALNTGHGLVPLLESFAQQVGQFCEARGLRA
jgi:hypothetical protein